MFDYLKRDCVAKDKLTTTSKKLKDSQVILITLGGLGPGYQLFVISITTHFDHTRISLNLHLLMDHHYKNIVIQRRL